MIPLNLTKTEREYYYAALRRSRQMNVRVRLLNRNEVPKAELTADQSRVIGGQVDIDVTRDPKRQLDLTVIDPDRKLTLHPDDPGEMGVFASTFVAVERQDWVDELDGYVSVPVFWGPVTRFTRNYPEVTIEALGKEALALDPYLLLTGHLLPKGTRYVTAIKRVLGAVGETKFHLPSSTKKLTHKISIPRFSEPWLVAQELGRGFDKQVFYDGLGRVRAVERPKEAVWSFLEGPNSMLLDFPDVSYDFTTFRNYVDVAGGKPKARQPKTHAVATLRGSHPLSPAALARNGVPRYAVEVVDDPQILRTSRAKEIADLHLKRTAELGVDADFEALPVPHLEEWDWIKTEGSEGQVLIQMKRWTIPLTSDSMPIGHNRVLRWKMKTTRRKGHQPWRKRHH